MHHSVRLNKNTDVMLQDADFITADFLYIWTEKTNKMQQLDVYY